MTAHSDVDAKPKSGASADQEDEERPRRVALIVTGPKSKQVREWVADELGDVELLSQKDTKGLKPEQDAEKYVAFAKKKKADAIVFATVEKSGKNWLLDIEVRSGEDGEVVGDLSLKGKSQNDLKKKIGDELAVSLAEPISKTKAPADKKKKKGKEKEKEKEKEKPKETAPEPEPAEEKPAKKEPKAKDEEEEPAEAEPEDEPVADKKDAEDAPAAAAKDLPSAIELGAGVKFFTRNFDYNDDVSGLRTYSLSGAPAGFVSLRLYPAAFFTDGFAANIGIAAGYERAFAVSSKNAQGDELDTSSQEFYAGLRLRLPFAAHEAGLVAAYGQHSFTIDGDESVPDVDYSFVRTVVDARFRFGKIVVGAHVGPRFVLGTGQLGEIFPDASAGGIELGLHGGYAVTDNLDLLLGVDVRRYYFTLNPSTTNPPTLPTPVPQVAAAGGAVDQYLGVSLGVGWRN
jgi:hypothetical protein